MRSLQSKAREKILLEQKLSSGEAGDKQGKCCYLCHDKGINLWFKVGEPYLLCYSCFRTIYFELVFPRIATIERARNATRMIEKIIRHSKASLEYPESVIHPPPSKAPVNPGSTEKACPRCTFLNPDGDTCEACGFRFLPSTLVCEACNVDCIKNKKSLCTTGQTHVPWLCEFCSQYYTLDVNFCSCGAKREWVCSFCSTSQRSFLNEHGTRCCESCGALNTAENAAEHFFATYSGQQEGAENSTVFGVNDPDTLKELRRQDEIESNLNRLNARLKSLRIKKYARVSDGNCLFSAIAHQLFGRRRLAHVVRALTVNYIELHKDDYKLYFEGDSAFNDYVKEMKKHGVWGDELCISAAARCFCVDIHVISSVEGQWYHSFLHNNIPLSATNQEKVQKGLPPVSLFLAYQNPVHYDDLELKGVKKINFTDCLVPFQKIIESEREDIARTQNLS